MKHFLKTYDDNDKALFNNYQVCHYLLYVLKKEVFLKFDNGFVLDDNTVKAYVYLKNKIFVNAYLIKSGLAKADTTEEYKYKTKFIKLESEST